MLKGTKMISIILCFLLPMLFFTGLRLLNYLLSYDFFSQLSISEALLAFIEGLRFDLNPIAALMTLTSFLILIPTKRNIWNILLATWFTLICIITISISCYDVFFFAETQRHIVYELLEIWSDIPLIKAMLKTYWYGVISLTFVALTIYYIFYRSLKNQIRQLKRKRLFYIIPILLLIGYFGTFGKLYSTTGRGISTSDAFHTGSFAYGNLALNGTFSSFQIIFRRNKDTNYRTCSPEDIKKVFNDTIIASHERPTSGQSLTTRELINPSPLISFKKMPNVLIFILESWDSQHINADDEPYFSELVSRGMYFDNFYSNVGSTVYGVGAVLTGMPNLPRFPVIGRGLEIYNIFRPGEAMQKIGYETFFSQTSDRESWRFDMIAKSLGFQHFYGLEDHPEIHKVDDERYWDLETFMSIKHKVSQFSEPWFGSLLTATTHTNYKVPSKEFEKYPHNVKDENGFKNTLFYVDHSLKQFMQEAQKKPWFDNTIFIFTADHSKQRRFNEKIPLLFYAPKLISPQKISTLGSQIDIMPTLIHLLGLPIPYASLGTSLLSTNHDRHVIGTAQGLTLITAKGFLRRSREDRLDYETNNENDLLEIEKRLLCLEQGAFDQLRSNVIFHTK